MTLERPWWIDAIYKIGVPSAIALYLVYSLTAAMPTRADIVTLSDQRKAEIAAIADSLRMHVAATNNDLSDIKHILVASCVNQAATDVQRLRCLGQIPIASDR